MRNQLNPKLMTALAQRLATYLGKDAKSDARKASYAKLRDDIANGLFDRWGTTPYLTRLAAEYVIQDAEQAAGSDLSAVEVAVDPWSLLEPTSQHYALGNPTPATGVFPHTPRRRARPSKGFGSISRRLLIILSLWLHGLNREASQDRIGYVWLVMDPLIQIMVISVVPLLVQPDFVYDMAILPFAIIGACSWLVFRTSVIGAMSGGGVLKSQLEHPAIRRFDIMIAKSFNALINYFVAGFVLLGLSIFFGMTDGPQNFPLLMASFGTSWVMGVSFGIIANSLVELYPGLRRLIVYSLRFIGLMSGLFYVPEQLPEYVAKVFLYNPLLQLAQLARTFWFYEYTTTDANVPYIFFWVLPLALVALVCLIVDEKRLIMVRA